ncbi:MAG TPA: hypothetical protein VKB78_15315 [Pirellulales bacterium]|nr:hypothetical protein [Pirellulales bacterium]
MSGIGRTIGIIAAVVGAVVGSIAGKSFVQKLAPSGDRISIDEGLTKVADQINKMMPMTIDAETRCDSVVPGPNKTISYHYTLVKRTKDELYPDKLVAYMRPRLVNNYKTLEAMKTLRDSGVILEYRYFDKEGVYITSITVDPKDFK